MSTVKPDAVQSWPENVESFSLKANKRVSGAIPDVLVAGTSLRLLDVAVNAFTGSIPEALQSSGTKLSILDLCRNAMSGFIGSGLASLTCLGSVTFQANRFSGPIPDGVTAWTKLTRFDSSDNRLTGPIPNIMMLEQVRGVFFYNNQLSGTIPDGVWTIKKLRHVFLHNNKLVGSLKAVWIPKRLRLWYAFSDNHLTGGLPTDLSEVVCLLVSGNMIEGLVPEMLSPRLETFDISGRPGRMHGGPHLPLPLSLTRALGLKHLIASHRQLGGVVPSFMATLQMLSLHSNELKSLSDARFATTNGGIFLHNNLLSCHLPQFGNTCIRTSLTGLGNQLAHPKQGLPDWVSPMERDKFFWIADGECVALLSSIGIASIGIASTFAATAAIRKVRGRGALVGWHLELGLGLQLRFACSTFLACIGKQTLLRVFLLLFLLAWDLYKCPRPLALLSACLRDDSLTHCLVALMWGWLGFHGHATQALTALESPAVTVKCSAKRYVGSCLFFMLVPVLSLPAIISQVGKSVPASFRGRSSWVLVLLSACIGLVQALLGTFVIPCLACRLTSRKQVYTTLANVLMNCLFPAVIVIGLDTKCFGHWVLFWWPCRSNAEQFRQTVKVRSQDVLIGVLRPEEVCNPEFARGSTSTARCIEHTLLSLQDLWLSKLITSGLLIPACRVVLLVTYKDTASVVNKLAILLGYSIIASGHLPLMMPLLLLAAISEVFLAVLSWSRNTSSFKHTTDCNVATGSIALIQALTGIVQLASASGGLPTLALVVVVLLKDGRTWLTSKSRHQEAHRDEAGGDEDRSDGSRKDDGNESDEKNGTDARQRRHEQGSMDAQRDEKLLPPP